VGQNPKAVGVGQIFRGLMNLTDQKSWEIQQRILIARIGPAKEKDEGGGMKDDSLECGGLTPFWPVMAKH
jgi:hypothetical protein